MRTVNRHEPSSLATPRRKDQERRRWIPPVAIAALAVAATLALALGPVAAAGRQGRARATPGSRPAAQTDRYVEYARAAADHTWESRDTLLSAWRAAFDPESPFGYRPPGGLIEMGLIYATLYERERRDLYADRAKSVLVTYGDYRSQYPEWAAKKRPDYGNGVPALPDFFVVMRFIRIYDTLHRLGRLTTAEAAMVEQMVAHSLDYLLQTSEWGTMNRTMLRAESLAWALRAMPRHARAAAWETQRRALGDDNWGNWQIEDATLYHGVWLYAMIGYADALDRLDDLFRTPEFYYYAHYFLNLMAPSGMVPDFGDSHWTTNWQHFLVFFETAAARLNDPRMTWAADTVAARFIDFSTPTSAGLGCFLIDASRLGRRDLAPAAPTGLSAEVMEDVQGKKVVFRDGWQPDSTYLLLTYRDEGDGGLNFRDYLRDSIPVEEEKMTHGHADENSIPLLMSGRSVLLHDGGYRDYMPSGPYGAYRQDYFHNRLVIRPEKFFMGQPAGGHRYSTNDAVPGQPILEFLRNAGSYRPIRTRKVDFLSLPEFDYTRTRLIDDGWGYDYDRAVVYLKEPNLFVVFDIFKAKVEEYFTLANLWHTRQIHARRDRWYDTGYDRIGNAELPGDRRLLVLFPDTHFRLEGVEPITRHGQPEQAIYQATARHFELAETEGFVTVLAPHSAGEAPETVASRIRLVETAPWRAGLGVQVDTGGRVTTVGIKLDLRRDMVRDHRRPRYLYEQGRVRYGQVETDGDLAVTTEADGEIAYTIVNMTRATRGTQLLYQVGSSFHGLPFDNSGDTQGYAKVRYWRDRVRIQ